MATLITAGDGAGADDDPEAGSAMLAWFGVVDSALPALEPGGMHRHRAMVSVLRLGAYTLLAECVIPATPGCDACCVTAEVQLTV